MRKSTLLYIGENVQSEDVSAILRTVCLLGWVSTETFQDLTSIRTSHLKIDYHLLGIALTITQQAGYWNDICDLPKDEKQVRNVFKQAQELISKKLLKKTYIDVCRLLTQLPPHWFEPLAQYVYITSGLKFSEVDNSSVRKVKEYAVQSLTQLNEYDRGLISQNELKLHCFNDIYQLLVRSLVDFTNLSVEQLGWSFWAYESKHVNQTSFYTEFEIISEGGFTPYLGFAILSSRHQKLYADCRHLPFLQLKQVPERSIYLNLRTIKFEVWKHVFLSELNFSCKHCCVFARVNRKLFSKNPPKAYETISELLVQQVRNHEIGHLKNEKRMNSIALKCQPFPSNSFIWEAYRIISECLAEAYMWSCFPLKDKKYITPIVVADFIHSQEEVNEKNKNKIQSNEFNYDYFPFLQQAITYADPAEYLMKIAQAIELEITKINPKETEFDWLKSLIIKTQDSNNCKLMELYNHYDCY